MAEAGPPLRSTAEEAVFERHSHRNSFGDAAARGVAVNFASVHGIVTRARRVGRLVLSRRGPSGCSSPPLSQPEFGSPLPPRRRAGDHEAAEPCGHPNSIARTKQKPRLDAKRLGGQTGTSARMTNEVIGAGAARSALGYDLISPFRYAATTGVVNANGDRGLSYCDCRNCASHQGTPPGQRAFSY
jgi:hypothetical protein